MFELPFQPPVGAVPWLRGAAAMLDSIALSAYESLSAADQIAACEALGRLESRVKAHQLAAAAAADRGEAAATVGATSTGALLANTFGGDPVAAGRLLKQARKLEAASATQAALAKGEVTLAQAELIADKVRDLPGDPTDSQREGCETQLLDDAQKMSLKDLGRKADRISETFAPDDVDGHEDEILRKREARAAKESYFWMADRRNGTFKGQFVIPEAQGEMLKNALEALNAPQLKHDETDPSLAVLDDKPTYGQQMAQAFMTLIEHLPADKLPPDRWCRGHCDGKHRSQVADRRPEGRDVVDRVPRLGLPSPTPRVRTGFVADGVQRPTVAVGLWA